MDESLGARIKRLRQERDLTLQHVADELGLTPAAISHWESGRIVPKSKKLEDLAKVLRVSVGELAGASIQSAPPPHDGSIDVDRIIKEAEEQIARRMGWLPHQVRLTLSYDRR